MLDDSMYVCWYILTTMYERKSLCAQICNYLLYAFAHAILAQGVLEKSVRIIWNFSFRDSSYSYISTYLELMPNPSSTCLDIWPGYFCIINFFAKSCWIFWSILLLHIIRFKCCFLLHEGMWCELLDDILNDVLMLSLDYCDE